ncbi:MAG TPA: hypothetical protein VMU94_26295 [Streptosporangiaceae bacterium]|nr:hypothetical protein [Streptosporangiaceae bacterium]
MTTDEPVTGLEGADLFRAASEAGCEISDRMLESFRAQGLIPRPRRAGYRGRVPVWQYPAGTDRQLAALVRWRQHSKDPDLLKVLLWMDGFAIPAPAIREALSSQLRSMSETMEQAISQQARRLSLDPADDAARDQAIDALAKTLSAKRGTAPIPRRSRVAAGERAHAMALILRMFGLGEAIDGTSAEAGTVERVMGIAPNGRRNAIADSGPWLTGPAEDLFDAATIVGLPNLRNTVADATDADLAAARQLVVSLVRYLPLMVRVIGALFDDENYTGLAFFSHMDQHPEFVLFVVPMVLAMLRAGWSENLHAVASALGQAPEMAAQMQRILSMPSATVAANLAGQPEEVREHAQRLIDAAVEGQLDLDAGG